MNGLRTRIKAIQTLYYRSPNVRIFNVSTKNMSRFFKQRLYIMYLANLNIEKKKHLKYYKKCSVVCMLAICMYDITWESIYILSFDLLSLFDVKQKY